MRKRILSVALTLFMVFTLPPVTARAGAESYNVAEGIRLIRGGQDSNIYFGTYQQSSDGEGGYSDEPIKWRVLDKYSDYYSEVLVPNAEAFDDRTYYIFDDAVQGFIAADHYDADAVYYKARDAMLLLADQNLDAKPYNTSGTSITWETSTIRSWLNGFSSAGENGANAVNPYNDSFVDSAFTESEQDAIAETALSGSFKNKIFLLSEDEANNSDYGFSSQAARVSSNTAYTESILSSTETRWWLRSCHSDDEADYVHDDGHITSCNPDYAYVSDRPAFRLDHNSVLFSTAADFDNSNDLARTQSYSDSDWKFTLKDGNTSFDVSMAVTTIYQGGTATVDVSSLGSETGYTQISAMLLHSGDVRAYGSIGAASTGEATFTVPADLSEGDYTLRIFAEDVNGTYHTDYASNTVDIPVEITADAPNVYVGEVDVTGMTSDAVTYWLNDNAGGIIDDGAGADNYNVKYNGSSRTLTLRNASLTDVHSDYISPDAEDPSPASVFTLWDLKIVLEGESRIEPSSGLGIVAAHGLDFSGDGSLSIDTKEDGTRGDSTSIFVDRGDIDIHSGSISVEGYNGISVAYGNINIYGGNVSAEGTINGIHSYDGNISIYGGMVSAEGLNNTYSYGVVAYGGSVTVCGGTVIAKAVTGSNNCYGVYACDDVDILGGAVYALGGTAALFSYGEVSPSAAYEKCTVIMTKEDSGTYTPSMLYNNAEAPVVFNVSSEATERVTDLWVGGFPFCTYDASLWAGVDNSANYGDYFHDDDESTANGGYAWRVGYDTTDDGYDLYLNGINIREWNGYPNPAGICANEGVDVDIFLVGASNSDIIVNNDISDPGGIIVENGTLRIYGTGTLNIRASINAISVEGGDLAIEGGTINAIGGRYSAGIGVHGGNLTINAGMVSVCGYCGVITTAGTIAVTDGTLTAKGSGVIYGAVYSLNQVNAPSLEGSAILGAETSGSVSGGVYTAGTRVSDLTHITWSDSAYREGGTMLTYIRIAPANTVTCVPAANGSFTAKTDGIIITHAAPGDTVMLTAAPTSGYVFSTWSVYKTGDTGTVVSVSGNTFTMPAYAVTVEAVFTEEPAVTYAITKATAENGSFTVSVGGAEPENAAAGDTVTLMAAPTSRYTLSSWNVYKTGDTATTVSVSGNSFTMPAYPVTIAASFAPFNSSGGGGGTSSRTITVTETSSELFSGAQGSVKAEADMTNAFSNSVEVKVTNTDEDTSSFGLGIGNTVYPFDISLYIKGTNTKTEPKGGYTVTISLPIPEELMDMKERLSIAHKADDGTVKTLVSQLKKANGVWYLVFKATEFSPYALVVKGTGTYSQTTGLPYYVDSKGNNVFIGFAVNEKYIAPSSATVLFKENTKNFTDTGSHWAKDYIGFVTEREIFLGTGIDTFSPDSGMTRAMFATVIGRLYEHSYGEIETMSTHAFTDCDYGEYYGKYVDWAAENNILDGYGNGKFGPDDSVTREQMATILYRFADYLDVLPDDMDTALSYPDASAISSWALTAAMYCQSLEIITGRDGGSFVPQGTATRAEVATIIQRFVESVLE